jgi:hypothetical protein
VTFNPITPVLVIRNISKSDVNILGVKIRPGQQKDIYQELEYDDNGYCRLRCGDVDDRVNH